MAKDSKQADADNPAELEDIGIKERKKEKKGGFPFVPVIVLLVIIGVIVAILGYDVFGARERWIMPYVRNAPLVGRFFPEPDEAAEEIDEGMYASMTSDEISAIVSAFEQKIESLESELRIAGKKHEADESTIALLREMTDQMDAFRREKARFDEAIAKGDPVAYKDFFESVSPENAERLYTEAAETVKYNSEAKKIVNLFAEMDESAAAQTLEDLLLTNTDMVVGICKQLGPRTLALIMEEMTPPSRAALTRLMYPESPAYMSTQPAQGSPAPTPEAPPTEETEDE